MNNTLSLNIPIYAVSLSSTNRFSRVTSLSLSNKTDAELVILVQAGNKKAFEILIDRWQNSIYTLCFRKLAHEEQSEELTQEIFFAAYKSIHSFRNEAKFSTWLFQIAVNRCKNIHGYRERRQFFHHEPLEGNNPDKKRELPDPTTPVDVEIQRRENAEILHNALKQLDDKYKEILILFDIQNIPQNEIADILSLPIGTVKSRIHRARVELANILKGKLDPTHLGESK